MLGVANSRKHTNHKTREELIELLAKGEGYTGNARPRYGVGGQAPQPFGGRPGISAMLTKPWRRQPIFNSQVRGLPTGGTPTRAAA